MTPKKPNRQPPLYTVIEKRLRDDITSGRYAQGSQLPSLRDLAMKFDCSVMPVRKAVLRLRADGLLAVGASRQGTHVI